MRIICVLLLTLPMFVSCGKVTKRNTVHYVSATDITLADKINELESKLAANDELINNLNLALTQAEGDNSEMLQLIEQLQEENSNLIEEINDLKCKKDKKPKKDK
jgi:uncharacterized coiled-coil protein SlyX